MEVLKTVFFIGIVFLSACVSQKERDGSAVMLDNILQKQCAQNLGFTINSADYLNCYNIHRNWLLAHNIDSSLSYKKINTAGTLINNLNQSCYIHWSNQNLSSNILWECIQQRMHPQLTAYKRQKNLEQQEQDLMYSFKYENCKMNESVLLQELMEKEKQRVAEETGKNINRIDCRISKTFNGKRKMTCH